MRRTRVSFDVTHKRHDQNPALRWMRQQVSDVWKVLERGET